MAMASPWTVRGRCWKFGDDVQNDGGITSLELTRAGVFDPERLAQSCMQALDPEFPRKVRAGDIVVAGKNFGKGQLHVQGPLGIKGLGLAVVSESMTRNFFRLCVAAGVMILPYADDITQSVSTGDDLEVNFASGRIHNRTTGVIIMAPPLPASLLEIIALGGEKAWLRQTYGRER